MPVLCKSAPIVIVTRKALSRGLGTMVGGADEESWSVGANLHLHVCL